MLAQLLAERPVLLADGATGTNLFAMGLANGEAPECWLDQHPERITALHQSFVDAGADIILTNSFGANARRLMLHGLERRTRDLNARAAQLARAVADRAGRAIVVAGSVGPTGDLFAPLGTLTAEQARAVFAEQILGLKEGGADVIWIETMSASEEMEAAAQAAIGAGMPWTLTASFDTAGRTMMGLSPQGFASLMQGFAAPPLAIGSNCGVGASDLVLSVLGITKHGTPMPVIAKANAGIPRIDGERVVYTATPETMEVYAHLAIDAGARIVGGCCGTSPAHLAAMRRAVDAHHAGGPRPDIARLIALLGPLAQPPAVSTERRTGRRARA
jgi:5-methyltetrahydrofolate--homocysteine methyltransferase